VLAPSLGLCAEDELLLLCVRPDTTSVTARIQELVRSGSDWRRVFESGAQHRVAPALYRALTRVPASAVPAGLLKALEARCAASGARNLYLLGELKKVVSRLEAHGISAIAYKGPVFAMTVYGSIAAREFGDLDVLVKPTDYDAARALLLAEGYEAAEDWGWESSWVRSAGMVRVDLHRSLTHESFPVRLDFGRLYGRLEREHPDVLAGIPFPGLVDTLIVLCLQLAKDAADKGPLRLSKLCDIAQLVHSHRDIDWSSVREESRRMRCGAVVAFGLLCARELLGARTPDVRFSRKRIDAPALLRHVRVRLFPAGATPAWRLSFERFHFNVRERWRDGLYPHYLEARQRVAPNEKDRAMLALPNSLGFLYYFVRPLRLIHDLARSKLRR